MERFLIGKTRSGVTVTTQSYADSVASPDDMFDTWAMLEAFCVRELGRNGQTKLFEDLFRQSEFWRKELVAEGHVLRIRKNLNISSYAARINFGKRLLNVEFRD